MPPCPLPLPAPLGIGRPVTALAASARRYAVSAAKRISTADTRGLATFRAMVAVHIIIATLSRASYFDPWWYRGSEDLPSSFPVPPARPENDRNWGLWTFHLTPRIYQMYLLAAAQVAAALCLLVGYHSNSAAFVTWLFEASLTHAGIKVDAVDCLACVANNQLLHLIVTPCGETWSVDALLRLRRGQRRGQPGAAAAGCGPGKWHGQGPVATIGTGLVVLQVCIMMWGAGRAKWEGDMWATHGTALLHTLNNGPLRRKPFGDWLQAIQRRLLASSKYYAANKNDRGAPSAFFWIVG
jgi:hypothetical protein